MKKLILLPLLFIGVILKAQDGRNQDYIVKESSRNSIEASQEAWSVRPGKDDETVNITVNEKKFTAKLNNGYPRRYEGFYNEKTKSGLIKIKVSFNLIASKNKGKYIFAGKRYRTYDNGKESVLDIYGFPAK